MPTPEIPEPIENSAESGAEGDRRRSGGNIYTRVRRRRAELPPLTPFQRNLRLAGKGIAAAVFLAAGVIWTVNQQQLTFTKPGELFQLPAAMVVAPPPVSEQVFRVSSVIRRYTKDTVHANKIATALIREGGKRNLDPALLIGLLIAENAKFDVNARSNVSARGLMQVMPFHVGKWSQCPSRDLTDIDTNVCYGTAILEDFVKRSPNLERALLRYNGCVRGTNTPRCHTYSGKVLRYADRAASQMLSAPFQAAGPSE